MFLSDLNSFDLKWKFCQVKFQKHMCDIVYLYDTSTRTVFVIPEISNFDICRMNVNNSLQIDDILCVVEYDQHRQVKRELNVNGWISCGNPSSALSHVSIACCKIKIKCEQITKSVWSERRNISRKVNCGTRIVYDTYDQLIYGRL